MSPSCGKKIYHATIDFRNDILDNSCLLEVLPHDLQGDEGARQARRHRKDDHPCVHGAREQRYELRHRLVGKLQHLLALGEILSGGKVYGKGVERRLQRATDDVSRDEAFPVRVPDARGDRLRDGPPRHAAEDAEDVRRHQAGQHVYSPHDEEGSGLLDLRGKEQIGYRCEEADYGYVSDRPHDGEARDASHQEEDQKGQCPEDADAYQVAGPYGRDSAFLHDRSFLFVSH